MTKNLHSHRSVGWGTLALASALACTSTTDRLYDDRADDDVLANAPDRAGAGGSADAQAPRNGENQGGQGSEESQLGTVEVTVTPPSLNLGAITQGFAARGVLRVSHSGDSPLTLGEIELEPGSNSALTLIQNQCTDSLAPGETCSLRVQVVPTAVGPIEGLLEIATVNGASTLVPITAQGLEAGDILVVPSAGSLGDFGGVRVGEVAENTFTITNPGQTASGLLSLAFNRPEFTVATASPGECVPGTTDLGPGESCDMRVSFAPTARGAVEATVSVLSSEAGSISLTLRGLGQIPGLLGVSSSDLDFGGVVPGDSSALTVTVDNQGDEPLTLGPLNLSAEEAMLFSIADSNCGEGVQLAAEESCRIELEFRPSEEGAASSAQLVVQATEGAQTQTVALRGVGLVRGNLLVEAVSPGEEDFGNVLLGESLSRTFRISNDSMQASGALDLKASNSFEVASSTAAEACDIGVTALENGESCTVVVRFTPTERGDNTGALTVISPLAGAKSLPLLGQGLAPALLEVLATSADSVVDFGRVTTGDRAERSIRIRNLGDQALPPPTLQVTSGTRTDATAFSVETSCLQELSFEQECSVTIAFAPGAAQPYSANLEVESNTAGRSTVLMIGDGLEPGRLVVTAVTGSSPDFGDLPIGQSQTRSFTVTNPGGVASGALTITSDDNQFVVAPGTCANAAPVGLVDGESCEFDVSFVPRVNTPTEARISIQSLGAGETGVALTGRGRSLPALAATTTERDLGRANIGEPSGPLNRFTWTVRNDGDLQTGLLGVDNSNPSDFTVSGDSCSNASVAGGSNCTVTVEFRPQTAGTRSGRISVVDSGTNLSVPLQVSGFGVRLSAPGESCVNTSDCETGVCSGGLCCNQACNSTCQSCSTGQCLELNNEEPCGGSGGVCFGVNQCALPSGQACSGTAQCGGNLECKQCRFGGSQCTASNQCCGGCDPGYQCVNGACGCPTQGNGLPQIDCGNGVCAQNRSGACCPNSPPAGCNCDPGDNLCKECLQPSDCPPRANSVAQCSTNRSCSYSCAPGFKSCNGNCIPNNNCCGGCSTGQECSGGSCISTGISCGGQSTCSNNNICCSSVTSAGSIVMSCASNPQGCPTPVIAATYPILCDESDGDCPFNQVCCFSGTSTSGEVSCRTTCTQEAIAAEIGPDVPPSMVIAWELCGSPAFQEGNPCPGNCQADTRVLGYSFCR